MKIKLISFLAISFIIGGSIFLVKPITADTTEEGCLANQNYSTITGQRCGCSHNEIYSSTTGQICTRDIEVTGFLTEQGPSIYMWGTHSITNEGFSVCANSSCPSANLSYLVSAGNSSSVLSDLRKYENSKVKITGKLQWYDLEGGFWGLTARDVILIKQANNLVISGISGPQSLNVNQTGTWKVTATDSSGGNLSYSVNWGDNIYHKAVSSLLSTEQVGQSATFTHIYESSGIYNPIFRVTNQNGVSTQTSLSVSVGNSIYPLGCTSNIGYSTITGINCGGRECMAPGSICDPYHPAPYIFERTLRIGDKGVEVQNLQTFLGLSVDGSFGPKTKARVMEWQKGVGLNSDGIFGPASRQIANKRY